MLALSKTMPNQNPIVLLCWERSRRAPAPQALEIHRFRWPKLDALRLHCWQPVIPIFPCESLWHEKIGKEFRVASQHILKVPLVDFEKYGDFQLSKSVGKEPISISWKLKGQVWKNMEKHHILLGSNCFKSHHTMASPGPNIAPACNFHFRLTSELTVNFVNFRIFQRLIWFISPIHAGWCPPVMFVDL